jgi:hypothetical protein
LCPPVPPSSSSKGIDDEEVGRSVELSVVGSTDSGVVEEVEVVLVEVVLVDVGVKAVEVDVILADVELEREESPSPPVEPPSNSGRTKDEKTRLEVEVEVVGVTSLIVASFPVSETCTSVGELVLDPKLEVEVEVLLVPVPATTGPFAFPFFFPSLDFFGVLELVEEDEELVVRGTSATKNPLLELALDEDSGGAAISTPSPLPPPPLLSTAKEEGEEGACEEITSEGRTNDEEPKEGDAEGTTVPA